ncbi:MULTISPECIES: hypothetical protein [Haloarcula]|uniref:hypothetical protein n=1 Tax=Haloarcula TaxID=2237 RepID=UPI0023EB1B3C|nr:hypothetical protein [Halomicroarcula sp. XH51]
MAEADPSVERTEDDDWRTRHARVRPRADASEEQRRSDFPESTGDDWSRRHAETRRQS